MTDRSFSDIFEGTVDAASAWQPNTDYTDANGNREQFRFEVPASGGPFVTADGVTLTADRTINLIYPAPGKVSAGALDAAEVLTASYVGAASSAGLVGDAVERLVLQRNRGQEMTFGDLHFRVPSSGNSSLQFRIGSGSVTISNFSTMWSNQQGGASENAFNFGLGTAWVYFRANGALNLTLHNSYQEATFTCNGWVYNVQVIVGSGWTNNRFSFTRWRLEALKGEPGTNGTDGVDASSIDHVSKTAGDSSPGTTDTYTLWGDAGETVNLGTYDVPIPAAASTAVLLGEYSGAYRTTVGLTLAGGRTWQDVLDEFTFVYILVGANSLFSHDIAVTFHVDDLTTQNRDMTLMPYLTHGSNAYHIRMITPPSTQTFVTINNDNSTAQFQRALIRGIT